MEPDVNVAVAIVVAEPPCVIVPDVCDSETVKSNEGAVITVKV